MSNNQTLNSILKWFNKWFEIDKSFPKKESQDNRVNGKLVADLDLISDSIAGPVERPIRIAKAGLPDIFPSSLNSVSDGISDFRVPAFILTHFGLGFIESQMQLDKPRWYRLLYGAFFGIGTVCVSASLTLASVPLAIFFPFVVITLYLTKGFLQTGYSVHQLRKLAKKVNQFNDEAVTDTIKLALLLNKQLDRTQIKIGEEVNRMKLARTLDASLEKLEYSLKKLQDHKIARKKLSAVINNYEKVKKYNFSAIENLWKNIDSPKAVQAGLESLKKLVLAQHALAQTIEETKAGVEDDILTEQAEKFLISLIGMEEWKNKSAEDTLKIKWISLVKNNDWKAIQQLLVEQKNDDWKCKPEGTWQYKRQVKTKEIERIIKNFNYKLTDNREEKKTLVKQFLKSYAPGFLLLSEEKQKKCIDEIAEAEKNGEKLKEFLNQANNEHEALQFQSKWQSHGVHKGRLSEILERLNKKQKKLNEENIRLTKIYLFAKSGSSAVETKIAESVCEEKINFSNDYSKQCESILQKAFEGKCSLDEAVKELELNKNSLFEKLDEKDIKEPLENEDKISVKQPLIEKEMVKELSVIDKDTAYELREILTSRSKHVQSFIEETAATELKGFVVVVYFCGFVGVSLLCTGVILGTLGLAIPFVFPIISYSLLAFVNMVGVYFGFKSVLENIFPAIAHFIKNITDNVLGLETIGKGVSFLIESLDALMKWPVNKVHEWKVKKIESMFFGGNNQPHKKTWEQYKISDVSIKEDKQEIKSLIEEKIKTSPSKLALQALNNIDLSNKIFHVGKALFELLTPLLKMGVEELKKELLDESVTIKTILKCHQNLMELQYIFPCEYILQVQNLLACLSYAEDQKKGLAIARLDASENPIKKQVENFYNSFITENINYLSFDKYIESTDVKSSEIEKSTLNSLVKCIGEINLSVENFSAFSCVIQQYPQLYENPWVVRGLKRFAEKCNNKDNAKIVLKFCDYLTCSGTLLKLQKKLTNISDIDIANTAFHDIDEIRKKIIEFLTIAETESESKEDKKTTEIFANIRQTTSNFFAHHPTYKSNVIELRHLKQHLSYTITL